MTSNQSTYHPSETLTLTGTILDEDGVNDLEQVSLWLQHPNRIWTTLSSMKNFSNEGGFSQSFDLAGYEIGTYQIWARAQDQQGAYSAWVNHSFTVENQGPTNLTFSLDEPIYDPSETLKLTGSVTDPNGVEDLNKVNLWLEDIDGFRINLPDVMTFDENGNFNFQLDLTGYDTGLYFMWADAVDNQGAISFAFHQLFAILPDYLPIEPIEPIDFEPIDELTGFSPLPNYLPIDFEPIDELTRFSPLPNYLPIDFEPIDELTGLFSIDPTTEINGVLGYNNMTNDLEFVSSNIQLYAEQLGDYHLGSTSENLPEDIMILSGDDLVVDVLSGSSQLNLAEEHFTVI